MLIYRVTCFIPNCTRKANRFAAFSCTRSDSPIVLCVQLLVQCQCLIAMVAARYHDATPHVGLVRLSEVSLTTTAVVSLTVRLPSFFCSPDDSCRARLDTRNRHRARTGAALGAVGLLWGRRGFGCSQLKPLAPHAPERLYQRDKTR